MMKLHAFEGRWDITRQIEDQRAALTGHFTGTCVWTPDGDGLTQEETGTLTYGAAPPMQATRRYLWRTDGRATHVFFDDGRAFHTIPAPGEEALHDCPPDTYRVRYTFDGPDAFSTIWHVTGPRKDAVLTTRFTRS